MNLIINLNDVSVEARVKADILVVLLLRISSDFFDYVRFSEGDYFAELLDFNIKTR